MRVNFLILFPLVLALALPSPSKAEWVLSWNDEFQGDELNSSLWDIEIEPPGYVNDELQGYTADSVLVGNGHLTLLAQKRDYTSPKGWKANYTSGRINTLSKKIQKYGKVAVLAKLPKGNGFWPAIWMLPGNVFNYHWPCGGEIDITEVLGQNTFQSFQTYHYNSKKRCGDNDQYGNNVTWDYDLSKDFHLFSMEWNETSVTWYLDEKLINVMHNKVRGINGASMHLPPSAMGVILNLAIGGDWPVPPDPSTVFPNAMIVDYVRVYHEI